MYTLCIAWSAYDRGNSTVVSDLPLGELQHVQKDTSQTPWAPHTENTVQSFRGGYSSLEVHFPCILLRDEGTNQQNNLREEYGRSIGHNMEPSACHRPQNKLIGQQCGRQANNVADRPNMADSGQFGPFASGH